MQALKIFSKMQRYLLLSATDMALAVVDNALKTLYVILF